MANVTRANENNFRIWSENVTTVVDSLYPDILRLTDGEEKTYGRGCAHVRPRHSSDLYAILFKVKVKARGDSTQLQR